AARAVGYQAVEETLVEDVGVEVVLGARMARKGNAALAEGLVEARVELRLAIADVHPALVGPDVRGARDLGHTRVEERAGEVLGVLSGLRAVVAAEAQVTVEVDQRAGSPPSSGPRGLSLADAPGRTTSGPLSLERMRAFSS